LFRISFSTDPCAVLPILEIAVMLVRLDHVASRVVNANHSMV
jgi:hypothetical protein